jgi:hypothetical protein
MLLIYPLNYADDLSTEEMNYVRQRAPEMIIHEEDLTYDRYKDSLKSLMHALDKYNQRKSKELGWEVENIGIPNCLLVVEGYGLKAQRDIAMLELKNAKLNRATKEEINKLESQLKEAENMLKYYLEHNIWVD